MVKSNPNCNPNCNPNTIFRNETDIFTPLLHPIKMPHFDRHAERYLTAS